MEEIWKPIQSLDCKYEVSNEGRIRNSKTHNIKAQAFDGHYYKFGYDYMNDEIRHRGWYRVHKAVAEAFVPNPSNKPTVNHIDGNHKNNTVRNLEWATPKEQSVHAAEVLHRNCGELHYLAKHSNDDVRRMRELYCTGKKTIRELAGMFSDRPANIRRIVKYERWKTIN